MVRGGKVIIHLLLAWLCVACASTEKGPPLHARHSPSDIEFRAIDGRIADLDFVTDRSSTVNSGIMTMVTADGDTFHLYTPSDIRCKSGTGHVDGGLGRGMPVCVYMRPGNVPLALKQYMPVEWAEVECKTQKP
jgi:hypothetical protein